MDNSEKLALQRLSNNVRHGIIESVYNAGCGHPGGSLSIADVLTYLYFKEMNVDPANPKMEDRDRFVLSKGHTAPALYSVLAEKGYFPKEELKNFSKAGSPLIGHPNNKVPGVEMSTGALGHGLPVGVGTALAAKRMGNGHRVFVVMGDGEQAEGSVWEAAMAGANYKLDNLYAIIDRNGLQISGSTEDVMALENFADKWRAFGWDVVEIDGNDMESVMAYFDSHNGGKKPHCLIARTVKGKGLPFAENKAEWHHHVPSEEQLKIAYEALGVEGVDWE